MEEQTNRWESQTLGERGREPTREVLLHDKRENQKQNKKSNRGKERDSKILTSASSKRNESGGDS